MENQSFMRLDEAIHFAYKDVYPCWPLIGPALAYNGIAIPGMAMNFGVIWVTVRTKSLRGTANFLLALYSFFELLSGCGNFLFLWTAVSLEHFVDYVLTVHLCAVPLFGLFASTMAITTATKYFAVGNDVVQHRLFRSLFCIIAFNVGGYFGGMALEFVLRERLSSPNDVWLLSQSTGILFGLSSASNGPILYWTSVEYQKAFCKEFGRLRQLVHRRPSATAAVVRPQEHQQRANNQRNIGPTMPIVA